MLSGKHKSFFHMKPEDLGIWKSVCWASGFLFYSPHRNGSVTADYQLTFLMPEEEQGDLSKFTLSREVVWNVFKQFLYDQDPDESGYIFPGSLFMSLKMF